MKNDMDDCTMLHTISNRDIISLAILIKFYYQ